MAFAALSTTQVHELYQAPDVKLVDTRDVDSYNGWCLHGQSRGGHIPGAKSIPHKWSSYIDWIEIVRSKNIEPSQKIIVYGAAKDHIMAVAKLLTKAGYDDVQVYNDFFSEWTTSPNLPLNTLARFDRLVPASWVKDQLSQANANDKTARDITVVHAHYRNPAAYESGHIPGAIAMDTLALEAAETWNRRSPEELKNALESHGISSDTTVILYGKFMWPDNDDPFPGSAAGHLGAIRCAVIMMYAGVQDVRVLNGGFQSWKDAGYEISTDELKPEPILEFGAPIPARPELFVDVPEAKEIISSDQSDLVSVRSWEEYIGNVSGYNYIEKKGRIPGSVFGNCGSDAYHMENYRNLDHTIREAQEVEQIWREISITSDRRAAFYCGTGWRGSEAFYNAWLMGWPNVAVFDGGWFEWSNDPDNPTATGTP